MEQDILDEAIEALRRKNRKRIVHRKIQNQQDFILVEDVYYQVMTPTKSCVFPQAQHPPPEETKPTKVQVKVEPETQPEEVTWTPAKRPESPSQALRHTDEVAIPRKVIFDPQVEEHKFQITTKKTGGKSFAKEVLKGAAEAILPSSFRKPTQVVIESPVRPIKGTHKTYAEMLEEMYPDEIKEEPSSVAETQQHPVKEEKPSTEPSAPPPESAPIASPEPTSGSKEPIPSQEQDSPPWPSS